MQETTTLRAQHFWGFSRTSRQTRRRHTVSMCPGVKSLRCGQDLVTRRAPRPIYYFYLFLTRIRRACPQPLTRCTQAMHLQGRRWAAGSEEETVFNSGSTFRSYGVEYGDRAGLLTAMPTHHQNFLRDLVWMHDCTFTDEKGEVVGVLAMHAGALAQVISPASYTFATLNVPSQCCQNIT